MEPIVLSGLLGFLVPPVVSFLKNAGWPKWAKVSLSVVVSVLFAIISLVQDGKLTDASWKQIAANIAAVVGVAQLFYVNYFGNTQVNQKLEAKKVL